MGCILTSEWPHLPCNHHKRSGCLCPDAHTPCPAFCAAGPHLLCSYRDRDLRGWIFKPLLGILILIPVGIFTGNGIALEKCPKKRYETVTTYSCNVMLYSFAVTRWL